jgi:hypothetical protein
MNTDNTDQKGKDHWLQESFDPQIRIIRVYLYPSLLTGALPRLQLPLFR